MDMHDLVAQVRPAASRPSRRDISRGLAALVAGTILGSVVRLDQTEAGGKGGGGKGGGGKGGGGKGGGGNGNGKKDGNKKKDDNKKDKDKRKDKQTANCPIKCTSDTHCCELIGCCPHTHGCDYGEGGCCPPPRACDSPDGTRACCPVGEQCCPWVGFIPTEAYPEAPDIYCCPDSYMCYPGAGTKPSACCPSGTFDCPRPDGHAGKCCQPSHLCCGGECCSSPNAKCCENKPGTCYDKNLPCPP